MAADDDVLDFEVADSVVDDRHHVKVDVIYEISDVAVDEHLAWLEPGDGFSGDAGVGAACVLVLLYACESIVSMQHKGEAYRNPMARSFD